MNYFADLLNEIKRVPMDELRKESFGYFEFVATQQQLQHIFPVLEQYFGQPFKPAGIPANKDAARYASQYGGVQSQQTLYYFEKDGMSNCAMIWPWQDKTRSTIKIAQGKLPH